MSKIQRVMIGVAFVLSTLSLYLSYSISQRQEPQQVEVDRKMHFMLTPQSDDGVIYGLHYTTKPGVIAVKLTTTGKLKIALAKVSQGNIILKSELLELEVQEMDVARFFCDACGANAVYITSAEEEDAIEGSLTQLR